MDLFSATVEPTTGFTAWYRAGRNLPWLVWCHAETEAQCFAQWLATKPRLHFCESVVLRAGKEP